MSDTKKDIDDDYEFSREKYRALLDQAEDVLPSLIDLARESESPRVFEVLSNMLKTTSDITDKLMDLQKKKREVTAPVSKPGAPQLENNGGATVTNNNVFIGDTTALQKMLLQQQQVIDINETGNS